MNKIKNELDMLLVENDKDYQLICNKLIEFKVFFDHVKQVYFNRYSSKDFELKLHDHILEDRKYSISNKIYPDDVIGVFYVKPKLNNPRIINQNGAFLLFGFASANKTKLEPPKLHFKLRAKRKNSYNSINIIIPKEYKQVIHDELKQLGIHRAFLFPEIDKVAQIVTNEYKIKKE